MPEIPRCIAHTHHLCIIYRTLFVNVGFLHYIRKKKLSYGKVYQSIR